MALKAAMDVGSNSIKLLVLELPGDGTYKIVHDEYAITGLGSGLAAGEGLQPLAIQASLTCIADMVGTAQAYGVSEIIAAGTAALRQARDGVEFSARVYRETGVKIKIVSPDEEARLSRLVALRELGNVSSNIVFFDIGGGSTELTWCAGGDAQREVLMPIGARQLTEAAQIFHPVTPSMEARLAEHIAVEFGMRDMEPNGLVAGLGGTAVTLTHLLSQSNNGDDPSPHMSKVQTAEISAIVDQLRPMTIDEVEEVLDFDAARAPVIFAGAFLLNELLGRFKASEFLLVDRGLRFGLLLED